MTNILGNGLLTAALSAVIASQLQGQIPKGQLLRLQAPSESARVEAFYQLVADVSRGQQERPGFRGSRTDVLAAIARSQDDVALALIRLLERENDHVATTPLRVQSERYSGLYYPDLFLTVAAMRDPRAIKSLIPTIGYGDVITSHIAALGEAAVPEVIGALEDRNVIVRIGAAQTLQKIATRSAELRISDASCASIRGALFRAMRRDHEPIFRGAAARALIPFDGEDIRREMEQIARSDSASIRPSETGVTIYVVRQAAEEWLRKHPKARK